jgi:flagellar basal-body rod protein FlgB
MDKTMADFSISRKLFDQTFGFIGRSLDTRTLNNKVLAGNIANSETPGYQAKEVSFDKLLEKSMDGASPVGLKRTHPNHLPENLEDDARVESTKEAVDIDREMAKLAENNVMFQAGVQTLVKKFEALKFTIIDIGR